MVVGHIPVHQDAHGADATSEYALFGAKRTHNNTLNGGEISIRATKYEGAKLSGQNKLLIQSKSGLGRATGCSIEPWWPT